VDFDKLDQTIALCYNELQFPAKEANALMIVGSTISEKEKLSELLFEKYQILQLSVPNSLQLIAYSYGISTGVVLVIIRNDLYNHILHRNQVIA
jgi:actin-related protein